MNFNFYITQFFFRNVMEDMSQFFLKISSIDEEEYSVQPLKKSKIDSTEIISETNVTIDSDKITINRILSIHDVKTEIPINFDIIKEISINKVCK